MGITISLYEKIFFSDAMKIHHKKELKTHETKIQQIIERVIRANDIKVQNLDSDGVKLICGYMLVQIFWTKPNRDVKEAFVRVALDIEKQSKEYISLLQEIPSIGKLVDINASKIAYIVIKYMLVDGEIK